MFYCYLFRCKDGSLYCGSTNNIVVREQTHNSGKGSRYVRAHGGGSIVYYESFTLRTNALQREREVKKLTRKEKLQLLQK